ncbi:hypothetical protein BJX70DRAFT_400227 [Aspergillus crustosus]
MSRSFCLALVVILRYIAPGLAYNFVSDNAQAITDTRIPVLYDISASQTLPYSAGPVTGFSTYSLLTTSTGAQFFVALGLITTPEAASYGASILDLTTQEHRSYAAVTTIPESELLSLNISRPGFQLTGLRPDHLTLELHSNRNNVVFNLTVHPTSRALYHGGVGRYSYFSGSASNWAFPAARTSGTVSTAPDHSPVELIPEASQTWYDRFWGTIELARTNSTLFCLFFDGSDLALAANSIDEVVSDPATLEPARSAPGNSNSNSNNSNNNTKIRFGNLHARNGSALAVVPITLRISKDNDAFWTSPRTGFTYPVKWELDIEGRGQLAIRAVVADQENEGGGGSYVGVVNFTGVFHGRAVAGFGSVQSRSAQGVESCSVRNCPSGVMAQISQCCYYLYRTGLGVWSMQPACL